MALIALILVGMVLAALDVIASRGRALTSWAVLTIELAGLLWALGLIRV